VGAHPEGAVGAAKRAAAASAALLVEDGMRVGLGTGSTVAYLIPALASRHLQIRCVATSPATASEARRLGLEVSHFDSLDRLDIAIDGADQVSPDKWLIKGGGGAHTREKIVAAAADRFVVIVSPEKMVPRLHGPVPVELMAFGLESTLRLLPEARVRIGAAHSPDGGVIADWYGHLDDPEMVATRLAAATGVVDHGLFPPEMVSEVIVGNQPARPRP
jgi:ribose 5-phosphate isomerase A